MIFNALKALLSFCFLEARLLCVALPILGLTLSTRVASNSEICSRHISKFISRPVKKVILEIGIAMVHGRASWGRMEPWAQEPGFFITALYSAWVWLLHTPPINWWVPHLFILTISPNVRNYHLASRNILMFLVSGGQHPSTVFMATVEPFTDIHLWLLSLAKWCFDDLGPVLLRLEAQGPSDFSFFPFFPHCKRQLREASEPARL